MSVKNGLLKSYNEDGKLIKVVPTPAAWKTDWRANTAPTARLITVTYYRNGYFQKEERINRVDKNGNEAGPVQRFYDTDQLLREGTYKDDKKDGPSKSTALTVESSGKKNTAWANWW